MPSWTSCLHGEVEGHLIKLDDEELEQVEAFRKEGVRYFQQNQIAAVGTGLLTLRRCSTRPNHLWFDEAPDDRSEPYGSIVSTIFDIRARFDSASDDTLLQQKFTTAPDLVSIPRRLLCRGTGGKPLPPNSPLNLALNTHLAM